MEHTAELLLYPFVDEPAINNPFEAPHNSWDAMFNRLRLSMKSGHIQPANGGEQDVLIDWLNRQILGRAYLTAIQFKKLDELGVDWSTPISRDHAWQIMFTRLQAFRNEFGHCRVPDQWPADKQLALWVMRQRKLNKQHKIQEYRKRLLTEIDFTWAIQQEYDERWNYFYEQLAALYNENGHNLIPIKDNKLAGWVERQRLSYKNKRLSAERERRLRSINFIWQYEEVKTQSWEDNYQLLRKFHRLHGHSFVPGKFKENRRLGSWVSLQRRAKAKGRLSNEKIEKLNKLGFVWSGETLSRLQSEYDLQWEQSFEKLKAYKSIHGTCQVSLKLDSVLQGWTVWQRRMFYLGKMNDERIKKLNEISFPWSVNEGYWMTMFDRLSGFYIEFGHTQVPALWKRDPRLAAWVYRLKANKDSLSTQKIDLLNTVGFKWAIIRKNPVEWTVMYQRLLDFRQTHGHTRVPVRWPQDLKLGKWVSRMRSEKSRLSAERTRLLEGINFDWKSPKKSA